MQQVYRNWAPRFDAAIRRDYGVCFCRFRAGFHEHFRRRRPRGELFDVELPSLRQIRDRNGLQRLGGKAPIQTDGSNMAVTSVGTGMISFADTNNATFDFTIKAAHNTELLSRMTFAHAAPVTETQPSVNCSGLRWSANETVWSVGLKPNYASTWHTCFVPRPSK